jgi:5'-nucleotidase
MRILVTNDDGINAPGLKIAESIAHALSDDVWVVAPETDQSGVSHSLSLNDPLRLREITSRKFAVKGTPTDCVIMALRHVMKDFKPDLVISGVNKGQNVAEDVTYSGTIAAAMEGTTLGVTSIALSQGYGLDTRNNPHWKTAETLAPELIKKILAKGIPAGNLININFPNLEASDVKGTRMCFQGRRDQELLTVDKRHDGRGNPYFWLTFVREKPLVKEGSDIWAMQEGYISVTPLKLDLTDHGLLNKYSF